MSEREENPAALTQVEFTLITLSQLPALSLLLNDSMATAPGHVSFFGIAQGKGQGKKSWDLQSCCSTTPQV